MSSEPTKIAALPDGWKAYHSQVAELVDATTEHDGS